MKKFRRTKATKIANSHNGWRIYEKLDVFHVCNPEGYIVCSGKYLDVLEVFYAHVRLSKPSDNPNWSGAEIGCTP